MNLAINLKCPSCKKSYQLPLEPDPNQLEEPENCSRCGCELADLIQLKRQSSRLLHLSWDAIRERNYPVAMHYVEESWLLTKEPSSINLGLQLSVLVKDAHSMATWQARANSS